MTKKLKNKKVIIIGGSRGIGREIAKKLKLSCANIHALSSKNLDTSNLEPVKNFNKKHKSTDILILNSGGPPNIPFDQIDEKIWYKYFNQLFLGYCLILKNIKINKNGYIFYISSSMIKEPNENLVISTSLRTAFSSILKSLSKIYSSRLISVINIAPGPFKTGRVKELIGDKNKLRKYEKMLPTKKIGNPEEIGAFVNFIIENDIKYISGTTIYMDGNLTNSFL